MKKIVLFFALCFISQATLYADIVTLRSDETQRYNKRVKSTNVFDVHQTFTFYNGEFVNIETTKSDYGVKSFTGRYSILSFENVYDDIKGSGVMFYLKKNNIIYAMVVYEEYIIMTGNDDNSNYIYTFYF
jgi:hypothetical protein